MHIDRQNSKLYRAPRADLKLSDFELLRRLGNGSFSEVVAAKEKASGNEYALKIVDKALVLKHQVVKYVQSERKILDRLQYNGLVQLFFTFQDQVHLYFGLELCPNGELYDQIQHKQQMAEQDVAFYAAEIVLTLEYLRNNKVIHRDIKPENLLLDASGHLKLSDFGTAKDLSDANQPINSPNPSDNDDSPVSPEAESAPLGETVSCSTSGEQDGSAGAGGSKGPDSSQGGDTDTDSDGSGDGGGTKRVVSLVGTAEYVAPEVLQNEQIGYGVDYWGLGCVIYQMLCGRPPFKDRTEYLTFQRITAGDYVIPDHVSACARDLISNLLVLDASTRLGVGSIQEIKDHPFFEGIQWDTLRQQQAPEFVPPSPSAALDEACDWELLSLQSLALQDPVKYTYVSTGAYDTGSDDSQDA